MRKIIYIMVMAAILWSCRGAERRPVTRSAYYWSTSFSIDSLKEHFLKSHRISRLYIRYFDVVPDQSGQAVPNATIRFVSLVPRGLEVVPVVYIVNDCMTHDISDLPDKMLRRILQMNATNDIRGVKEIQIDCDWTQRTQKSYFSFLQHLHDMAARKGILVSATIRLHQLSQTPPPVDRGVLMMYNTGDFTDIHCQHPILDMRDVAPYLKYVGGYALPLSAAYPLFRWRLLYRGGKYVGIIHHDEELPVLPADSIICRQPSLSEILRAKQTLQEIRGDINDETILFDINDDNITRFNLNGYEKIFNL